MFTLDAGEAYGAKTNLRAACAISSFSPIGEKFLLFYFTSSSDSKKSSIISRSGSRPIKQEGHPP
jgi:hypothetical protein